MRRVPVPHVYAGHTRAAEAGRPRPSVKTHGSPIFARAELTSSAMSEVLGI